MRCLEIGWSAFKTRHLGRPDCQWDLAMTMKICPEDPNSPILEVCLEGIMVPELNVFSWLHIIVAIYQQCGLA